MPRKYQQRLFAGGVVVPGFNEAGADAPEIRRGYQYEVGETYTQLQ